jgi:hypothetical protein
MSFGFVPVDLFRDCARIVAEIFNGANPANIPISQPTKYEIGLIDQVGDRNRLTIGEGVETTLLLCAARPVGRAGSWPYKCARRWCDRNRLTIGEGVETRIVTSDDDLSDMNDVLLQGAGWHVVDHQRPSR